jgi:hypothetical protein
MLGLEPAGLHLRGESSNGKSSAMMAAISVWGSPNLMFSWRATTNALEGAAAICNGALLPLDEFGEANGKEVGEAVYMLANGQGKARMASTGQLRAQNRWRAMLLSTGELTLADFLRFEQVNREILDGDMMEMIQNNPADVVYTAFSQAFLQGMIRMFQKDNEMKSIVLSDSEAREMATRHFFRRAQRMAREAPRA